MTHTRRRLDGFGGFPALTRGNMKGETMKRHRMTAWRREAEKHDRLHTLARRFALNVGLWGGHYGAIYWALCARFDTCGVPMIRQEWDWAKRRWFGEVTGGNGDHLYRPHHETLWNWAREITEREYASAMASLNIKHVAA